MLFKILRVLVELAALVAIVAATTWFVLSNKPYPETYEYGVSFMTPYANDLGIDWEEAYVAMLEELEVKKLRLAAHWPMVEPENDEWNFEELDRQMELAAAYDAQVVLAVGRRVPRWPECHVPDWAKEKSWEEQKAQLRVYLTEVVNRYKDHPALELWQVENEPFLTVFAHEHCGDLDYDFLKEEVALVKELDPDTQVLVTDSGNLGLWYGAYKTGDVFGTSVYVYLNNEQTGPLRTILPPETYMLKQQVMRVVLGKQDTLLIELSLEPWVNRMITTTPIDEQLELMSLERVDEILEYAKETRLDTQYLWGVEWWYWLREQGHPEYWEHLQKHFISENENS